MKADPKALKRYRSRAARVVHRAADAAHKTGVISKETMRSFDADCLTKASPITPQDIKKIREASNVSQRVFAAHLGVTPGLVSQWERGEKRPSPMARKVLAVVKRRGLSIMA